MTEVTHNVEFGPNLLLHMHQVISPDICRDLINLGEGKWKQAQTDESSKKNNSLDHRRKSDVVGVDDKWIYDLIWPYMESANERAGWKYDITFAEMIQITRYTKNGFYSWHRDGMGSHKEIISRGSARKLSMSVILNDDFEGGDFEIYRLEEHCSVCRDTPKLKTGSIYIFPSVLEHRVSPVTKGTRYSLVIWFLGPPFK